MEAVMDEDYGLSNSHRTAEENAELASLVSDLPYGETRRVTLSTGRVVTVRNGLGLTRLGRMAELGEVIMRKDAEIAALRGLVAALEAERLEAIDDKAAEPSAGVVAERVDAVIGDVLAGRTTQKQNRVLREVSERAERISPKADAAVGKAVGG